ncbi:MAG: hypothetical protein methR_P1876 [Methyloprofundus sp.]|nr:MAG: hypothetical protein methR_P1876 [Methyloprofundus sp.]
MSKNDVQLLDETYNFQEMFAPVANIDLQQIVRSNHFERVSWNNSDKSTFLLDKFSDIAGAACCFGRFLAGDARKVRLVVQGGHELLSCPSGGWVLKANDASVSSYWIPQLPILRKDDSYGRILAEEKAAIVEFKTTANDFAVVINVPKGMLLDMVVWSFTADSSNIVEELANPLVLEKQPVYFWTSETGYQAPADLYLYLLHGHIYSNSYRWPQNWKMCSDLDAYGLYVTFNGLESSTNKALYSLFKTQVLFSTIARQAEDGAWYHGEWTDCMESHYRFHNGAMLMLEASLQERPDKVVSESLARSAAFIAQKTDDTDLGLWFMHDSLEDDVEMMEEMCRVNKSNWIKEPILGKSMTNKLIFNTHVDTLVTLDRYRQVTGDTQYAEKVDSACKAALGMLALRPAEAIYKLIYRAIKLTLLPTSEAEKLPVYMRAFKRISWMYIAPNLYRIKNIYPRLMMPGGYIERQLGMGHYDINYHSINILDLVRLWRCFPNEDIAKTVDEAIAAVSTSSLLDYWAEKQPWHKSLVEWVDAMFHLCTLKNDTSYRKLLAEGIIKVQDAGIGLPPSVLGGDPEVVSAAQRVANLSPTDDRIRIANLSCGDHEEVLVVNTAHESLELVWEGEQKSGLVWMQGNGEVVASEGEQYLIPARSWILGK